MDHSHGGHKSKSGCAKVHIRKERKETTMDPLTISSKNIEPEQDKKISGLFGTSNAIMESTAEGSLSMIRSSVNNYKGFGLPSGKLLSSELTSIELRPAISDKPESFLLFNKEECLEVSNNGIKNGQLFSAKCGCEQSALVKVVSIFGKTGEGKSHTLNHLFFKGREVFSTSSSSVSCTEGVWAAYDPELNIICLDTEGLSGMSGKQNLRMRMLLKVLAISDVVIYQTRSERLHADDLKFLAEASKAYKYYFLPELKFIAQKRNLEIPTSAMSPSVIIHHETQNTEVLKSDPKKSAECQIQEILASLELKLDAFSDLKYIGKKSCGKKTDYTLLRNEVASHLHDCVFRVLRKPSVIFQTLNILDERFSDNISENGHLFPDEYFSCPCECLSCGSRCEYSLNHTKEGVVHSSSALCRYQNQFDNHIYKCSKCLSKGKENIVVPKTCSSSDSTIFGLMKYTLSGYVLECPECGIIYRSRQYWFGNQEPVGTAVQTEIVHVWPDGSTVLQGTQNAARKVIDGINYFGDTMVTLAAKPAKYVSSLATDMINPSYWRPDSEIIECHQCHSAFLPVDTKHHCRSCGEGFCDKCSSYYRLVPERGWKFKPVRVCRGCYDKKPNFEGIDDQIACDQVKTRELGEMLADTLSAVASTTIKYPLSYINDNFVRPAYWRPDHEISDCYVCGQEFTIGTKIHHCRNCGEGVCGPCSGNYAPVVHKGWDNPVRICDKCISKKQLEC